MATKIQQLQAQIDLLMQERSDRADKSDPEGVNLDALKGHLATRQAMLPQHDFSDLIARANELDSDLWDPAKTEAFNFALARFAKKNGPIAHELAVIEELGENAHQHALDSRAAGAQAEQNRQDDEADPESDDAEVKDEE